MEPDVAEESPGIDPVLLEILARETAGHLDVVRAFLHESTLGTGPCRVSEELHRACHTLHGSVTMAKVADAAALTGPLYDVIERVYRSGGSLQPDELRLCAESAAGIEAVIAALADPVEAMPDTSGLVADLQAAAERHAGEPQDAGATVAAFGDEPEGTEVPKAAASASPSGTADHADAAEGMPEAPTAPDFDADIAAIFYEEAGEILAEADTAIGALAANRDNPAPLAELQRHLHTLKGGARMAGIVSMGDFSHELESLLMRIDQGGMGLDDAAFGLLQASVDDLHRMREEVMSGAVAPPDAELAARLAGVVEATMMTPALIMPPARPEPEQAPVAGSPAEPGAVATDDTTVA